MQQSFLVPGLALITSALVPMEAGAECRTEISGAVQSHRGQAFAQAPVLPPQTPNMPDPRDVPAEKIEPSEPGDTGSTLSDKLERSGGVIRPPIDATPDMRVPAPVPDPGTTPVIRPPQSQ